MIKNTYYICDCYDSCSDCECDKSDKNTVKTLIAYLVVLTLTQQCALVVLLRGPVKVE